MIESTIASRIKTARENAGLTQEKLAASIEYSVFSVSKWETGSSIPPKKVIKKIFVQGG